MGGYFARIRKALADEHYADALRMCSSVLFCEGRGDDAESRAARETVIQLIHGSGMREKILATIETYHRNFSRVPFGWIYGLYKFEYMAFGEVSLRTMACMTTYYELSDDRMAATGCSGSLRDRYLEAGMEVEAREAQARYEKNLRLLQAKAAGYQEAGEYRYAFNSYRCLLECDPDSYEYHHGYLYNAIRSGKPEEAYKTILGDRAHRDFIQGDETLRKLFHELVQVTDVKGEGSDTLQ